MKNAKSITVNKKKYYFYRIEWQDILEISSDIPKDEEIYLYCRSGNRSGKATKILLDAGYINAKNAGSISEASKLLNTKIID